MVLRLASSLVLASLLLLCSFDGWAQKPELVVQTGHTFPVTSVAFSPDGKLLVSGSNDNTVKLWDIATGTELRTFIGHSYIVSSVAFSPDGKTIASGGGRTIKLWDVATGAALRTLEGYSGWEGSVAFSPDGNSLASTCNESGTIKLWAVATGVELRTFTGHAGVVTSVAFSPDGQTLASSSDDKSIKLWNVATGGTLRTLAGHYDRVKSVAFGPDGKTLASGGWNDTAKLWEVATGALLRTFKGSLHFYSVAFSRDGKSLAGVSVETVTLWDVATGSELRTRHAGDVTSVIFSPDGKTLANGSGKDVKLYDTATGVELRTFIGRTSPISAIVFSPDGKKLARSSGANVRLWDVVAGAESRTLKGHSEDVYSVAFSFDGKLLASGSRDRTIRLWDVATGTELRKLQGHTGRGISGPAEIGGVTVVDALAAAVTSVAFSPDGRTLASGSERFVIKFWDVASGAELRSFRTRGMVNSLAFSPDGKTLASGGGERVLADVYLWDVATGTIRHTLKGKSEYVAFSPDGTLASGSSDNTVKLWDGATGAELRAFPADAVNSAAFSSNGKTLATGSKDKTIKLWDVATGVELRTLNGHSDSVTSVRFSPNNKHLLSGSYDATVKVWDVSSGQELVSLIALDERDWIVLTPDGLFDGSPAAWNQILWRFNNNTFDYSPVEAFFDDFFYPGLLADALAGKRLKAPSDISQKDRRQPELNLTLSTAGAGTRLKTRNVTLKIDASQALAGAQDVRLFRNGLLVKVWRGDVLKGKSSVTLEATIPIVAGANNFAAYAFNRDNIKSSDATLIVNGGDSLKRPGTAYILAIGINRYSNPRYNLRYAVADADGFSAEVKRQQELLKRYAQVEVISLSNAEATKANITQKLTELASRVQPEDAVIIFFAGHGTAHGKQFYLIPHDLGYRGRREKLSAAGLQTILAHSISDRDLEKLFEDIDAGQLLLVIDACNSGQALEAEEKRRGPMNSKGLAQLAYEKGMYVLTAAQSYQAAQEAAKFGHGFLTYALVEDGLKQGKADREQKDGTINLREWLNYATEQVPRMQEENMLDALRGRSRYLNFVGDGSGPKDIRNNVQRPRIFYRRELDSNPLVVAVLGTAATP